MTDQKPTPEIQLKITLGNTGLFYVESPQIPGLLATGSTIPKALADTANAYLALVEAGAEIPRLTPKDGDLASAHKPPEAAKPGLYARCKSELSQANAEIERLREALEPFANCATAIDNVRRSGFQVSPVTIFGSNGFSGSRTEIEFEHFFKARAALKPTDTGA